MMLTNGGNGSGRSLPSGADECAIRKICKATTQKDHPHWTPCVDSEAHFCIRCLSIAHKISHEQAAEAVRIGHM